MTARRDAGARHPRGWRGALAVACIAAGLLSGAARAQEPFTAYAKAAPYDDVRFELHNAIIGRGLVIDFNGQVSDMLERTGADVGSTRPVYRKAEYFTFCSAKLSRSAMEVDPVNAGFCPYVVFIFETAAAPGTTHVGYRRLEPRGSDASRAALAEIDRLLDGIARDAVK